jgi:peptidyl-prolyl cis-trans isomerase A (cyclophilin A)
MSMPLFRKKFFLSGMLLISAIMNTYAIDREKLADGLYALIDTNRGEILVSLEYKKTPLTVINFTGLAEGKMETSVKQGPYYDGLKFHRVIDNFMIQGGDPLGNGTGGPGYKFGDEIDNSLQFDGPGILAMANAGPGTNGSQFFITHEATPWLQGKHTIFGHVVEGQNIIDKIRQNDTIKTVEIIRVGAEAQAFKNDQTAFDTLLQEQAAAERAKMEEDQKAVIAEIQAKWPNAQVSDSGIRYIIEKEGTGGKPSSGATVKVHYTGMFMDGRKFDSSVDRGTPFELQAGVGQVIPGWDETLLDMKKGEKRTIILPPELAYGSRGAGGVIPPNAWLVFEVEMLDF